MKPGAGIVAAATCFPERTIDVSEVCRAEGADASVEEALRLGFRTIRAANGETGSQLAEAAAREAIALAGIDLSEIGVIVDYSFLPQEYLVPAWSMSNKLQGVLGAKKAFTVGFSGGAATGFLVSLRFAASLLESDPAVGTALLVGADVALPANRLLNRGEIVTVLGDGASAIILKRDAGAFRFLDAEIVSEGRLHDVCYIPGGAMAYPDREDLYRLRIDLERYDAAKPMGRLRSIAAALLERARVRLDEIGRFLVPNLSEADQEAFAAAFGVDPARVVRGNVAKYGHVFASDFVVNYITATEELPFGAGPLLLCSHGFGFTTGAALLSRGSEARSG